MPEANILNCMKLKFLTVNGLRVPFCTTVPDFVKICQAVADMAIFRFYIMAAAVILDLLDAYLNNPRRVPGGVYRSAKFGWNRYSSFDNTAVSVFCAFGLKTPIYAPKLFFWRYNPLSRVRH